MRAKKLLSSRQIFRYAVQKKSTVCNCQFETGFSPVSDQVTVIVTLLATCINYADLNNSMLCMRGHVSASFFRCDVLFLYGKHNGFRHILASA